ncbi:alcohol dehydrogenase catalytic domain-containing protein [Streptosporangium canum]|uniref:alcohol dehydrogenase catalytic domain-containing protein n=1 Tax=Streptosporangium canum TaxID=324952 RepID=UPI0037A67FB6
MAEAKGPRPASPIDGSRPRPLPMALGHEAAGEVVATGGGTEFAPGDHVVPAFVPACGHCPHCAGGRPALCEPGAEANGNGTLLGGGLRLTGADGGRHRHHLGVSAFSEHIVVSARSAVRVDPRLPFEIAALFGCAVLTGAGAAFHSARVAPGDSVAVFGLSGVGLAALIAAKAAGAATLIAVDVVGSKRALARELGATHAVAGGPDAQGQLPRLLRAAQGRAAFRLHVSLGDPAGGRAAVAPAVPGGGQRGLRPPAHRRGGPPGDRLLRERTRSARPDAFTL